MFYHLPPVGHPIRHVGCDADMAGFAEVVSPYQYRFYASGTAALAAAMLTARNRKPDIQPPEVILPAYACPDLVSAAVFAGVKPVLVDLEPERPWMDLDQLTARLNERTVAVVAVNFLGILERHHAIRPLLENTDTLLIEDSAQAFPRASEPAFWQGDLVVLSFGRGKPLSLLGGGALLYQSPFGSTVPVPEPAVTGGADALKLHLKTAVYNQLINPRWYWLPEAIPGLRLGETRYHPLPALEAMSPVNRGILPCNLEQYRERSLATQQALREDLRDKGNVVDLPAETGTPGERALLRYPVLLDTRQRERLYNDLCQAGMGVSRLYPSSLPSIPGIDKMPEITGEFPRAEAFSQRLLTLPTHAFVRPKDRHTISSILGTE